MAALSGKRELEVSPKEARSWLQKSVDAGAVDGVTKQYELTVDGHAYQKEEQLIAALSAVLDSAHPPQQKKMKTSAAE